MEIKGFNDEISEQNKKALQSETWQAVRTSMKTEIKHFVNEALVKDDPYGYPWEQVVDEYLKSGYKEENSQYELTVRGSKYKVLKRENVTVFYDADGNTLFDVVNERLEMEYKWLINNDTKVGTEDADLGTEDADLGTEDANLEKSETDVTEEENADTVKTETDTKVDETPKPEHAKDEKEAAPDDGADDVISSDEHKELTTPAVAEVADSQKKDGRPVKLVAKEKLEKELKGAKEKNFAEPIIGYLLKRCEEDEGLAQDVAQEHKTWKKCFDYIYSQARKQAKNNCAAVRDDVVYEWAEDYYHKDDKAEEEKKAKKEAERKAKQKKEEKERKAKTKDNPEKTAPIPQKRKDTPKEPTKPKKGGKDIEGQLDIFSIMGM